MDARLDEFDRIIADASLEALPGLIGELARLHALALARLVQPAEQPPVVEADRLLTAEEAAALTGLTTKQLRSRRLPFRKKIGHRTLRYSERALRAWLRRAS